MTESKTTNWPDDILMPKLPKGYYWVCLQEALGIKKNDGSHPWFIGIRWDMSNGKQRMLKIEKMFSTPQEAVEYGIKSIASHKEMRDALKKSHGSNHEERMMKEYTKIQTLFKRDMANKGKIVVGDWSLPEFDYLQNNEWVFTEKVDGTNIRARAVFYTDGRKEIQFGGRTDAAQIPATLIAALQSLLPFDKFATAFEGHDLVPIVLYGEGYGAKIQNGGNYRADPSFVLFDVLISNLEYDSGNSCPIHSLNQQAIGELSGKEQLVTQTEFSSQKDSVNPAITKTLKHENQNGRETLQNGPPRTGTVLLEKGELENLRENAILNQNMESASNSSTNYQSSSTASVQFAGENKRQKEAGGVDYPLPSIIATQQEKSEGFCVPRATLPSTKPRNQESGSRQLLCTCRQTHDWWLQRETVEEIASKLGVDVVPIIGRGTLHDAINMTQGGLKSTWGDFTAEGIVLRPAVELKTRKGDRLIGKIKHRDFTGGKL